MQMEEVSQLLLRLSEAGKVWQDSSDPSTDSIVRLPCYTPSARDVSLLRAFATDHDCTSSLWDALTGLGAGLRDVGRYLLLWPGLHQLRQNGLPCQASAQFHHVLVSRDPQQVVPQRCASAGPFELQ